MFKEEWNHEIYHVGSLLSSLHEDENKTMTFNSMEYEFVGPSTLYQLWFARGQHVQPISYLVRLV